MAPRLAAPADLDSVLALNTESERFLSQLDAARLAQLDAEAERHWVIEAAGRVVAFVLVFREGADYDIEPPNPASAHFHAALGFREVGRQAVADGRKSVTLQVAPADDGAC